MTPDMHKILRAVPVQTVSVAFVTLLIAAVPEATDALTATRENAAQIWPLLTGHLCHWTPSHLFWDLAAFAVLAPVAERRLGKRFLPWLATTAFLTSVVVFLVMPEIHSYRGLSAIDSFLAAFVFLDFYQRIPRKSVAIRILSSMLPVGFLAKLIFEFATGQTVFASSLGPDVVPLPLAHLAGILLGSLAFLHYRFHTNNPQNPLLCLINT